MDLDALWDFEDPARSEAAFLAAAAGSDEPVRSRALTQAARELGLQGRFDEGLRLLAGLNDVTDAETRVRAALERGRLSRSAGLGDRGTEDFLRAASLAGAHRARTPFGRLEVDALHMLAMLPDDAAERVRLTEDALAAARTSPDPTARTWEASLLNNLGMARHDAGDLAGALVAFEEALAQREARGQRRESQIARWMVAWTLRLLGRNGEALAMQRALAAELAADGIDDTDVAEELAHLTGGTGSAG